MKTLTIDLRWIDSSGIGTYIQGIMPGIVAQLSDTAMVGLGNVSRLREFGWSSAPNVRLVNCRAARYSLAEQWQLPLAIPADTALFFAPHYPIPLAYRGPLAVTVHDMSHLVVPEIAGNWKKRLYAQTMFRSLRKRASLIFTVSRFSKEELLRLTSGSRNTNIVETPLGIADQWYGAAQLPRIRRGPYLVYVGNVKPYKNVARLVEAFLAIRNRIPHNLVIVGQSEGMITGESQSFFDRVREGGDRIELTGHVSNAELLSLVGHAAALVLPSLYEGFGLPPVEAMAAGVPVAVSRTASMPEVCGEAALYFDPLLVSDIAEKLLALLTDPALSQQCREKGLERSRTFRWQACSDTTAKALRQSLCTVGH